MNTLKKIIRIIGLSFIILGLVYITPSIVSAASDSVQSSKTSVIQIYLNNTQITSSSGVPTLLNGSIMLPLDGLYISSATVIYDERTKMISIANMFTKGSMKVGGRSATVNGKVVTYSEGPQLIDKYLYIPLRFVNDAIGGTLNWNAVSRKAIINYPEFVGEGKISNGAYFLNGVNGTLYKRDIAGVVRSLGVSTAKLEPGYIGNTQISFVKITEDTDLVTIRNSSGEPSMNLTVINLFVKKGAILRQSTGHYWQFSPEDLKIYNGNAVMNDGHVIRLIAPDASVKESWNLSKLVGEPDFSYSIEAIGESYLIARSSQEGLLTLIDIEAKQAILLYKEFGINPSDMPGFKYDGIIFTGNGKNKSELQFEFTDTKKIRTAFTYQLDTK
ncbi:copper amine oxidase N-terminal domain-containing protein [Paenibacillus sp. FSL F4-0125]|uniref:copper amine oxidase N-terminal domain-containing protein n=1 Tax=Paenibacillus sp. FSL F4-0125 TaxID=2954730 RepID=UPI0030FA32FC